MALLTRLSFAHWLLLLGALTATGAESVAAATFSASLDPVRVTAKPGQVLNTQVKLTLIEGEPRTAFRAQVEDWWRSEDGRQSFYTAAGTLARSCGKWVALNPVETSIAGGDTLTVRVTLAVPADVAPGGYWCALTIDEVPDPLSVRSDGVGVHFLASLSTGIYVSVEPVEKDALITAIEFSSNQVIVAVRNTGNTPVPVEGRVEFTRVGDSAIAATTTIPRGALLLDPIPTLRLSADLPDRDTLPSGRYLVRVILDIGLEFYLGVQREFDVQRAPTDQAAPP